MDKDEFQVLLINCQVLVKTTSFHTTPSMAMILGIKLTYIDTKLIHHMAITVLNIKECRHGFHYLTVLNVSN